MAEVARLGARGRGLKRWIKPVVSVGLYVLVFYWTDASSILGGLREARLEYVALGALLYAAGQVISAWRWKLLLGPVRLTASLRRLVGFYFTGMFFNLFLPTIVGGDAVKAFLLSKETGAPARSTVSVFMERNIGLLALLVIALGAAWLAPPVELGGVPLTAVTLLLAAGFAGANLVLFRPAAYRLLDRAIGATPLARLRPRAASLYAALDPYRTLSGAVMGAFVLSLAFQGIVIGVVFLNTLALSLDVPVSAVAVFVPLVSLAGMIPVSVNGLGVREALYILLFGRIGIPAELAVSLALLYLAVTVVVSLPGGLAYALQKSPGRLTARGTAPGSR
jgi:glycosyltransferase 2 family protein